MNILPSVNYSQYTSASTVKFSGEQPTLSAKSGAEAAIRDQLEADQVNIREKKDLEISKAKAEEIKAVLKELSNLVGVHIDFTIGEEGDRTNNSLTIGLHKYNVNIGPQRGGSYNVYKVHSYPSPSRKLAVYEGGGKTKEGALQSIAYILGTHFPEHADGIDSIISKAVS